MSNLNLVQVAPSVYEWTDHLILDIDPIEDFGEFTFKLMGNQLGIMHLIIPYFKVTPVGDPTNNRLRTQTPLPTHIRPPADLGFQVASRINNSTDLNDVSSVYIYKTGSTTNLDGHIAFYGVNGANLVQAQPIEVFEQVIAYKSV